MKESAPAPVSNVTWLQGLIADKEEQLEAWQASEGEFLTKRAPLHDELAEHQRNAKPGQAAALAKTTAKVRAAIAEVDAAIADARDAQDRLTRELAVARAELIELESREARERAVRSVAAMAEPAAAVERAVGDLIAAMRALRAVGAKAGDQVREALVALGNDEERMLDYQDIVVLRAAGRGFEMGVAVIGLLREIVATAGTKIDDHVQFNQFISCGETPTSAVEAAVRVVASRLNVQVQP